ncbi:hypothetical protein F5879DRAFT_934560 [Lentinula edodes]|nr:hypothetical protein F5879DRAFT_934560 [Lentinula edodes]
MLNNPPRPVLNVSVDALQDLDGSEALAGLWFLFSKCQFSLNEGRRLENISWRLWSQQIAGKSLKYRPLTPDSPSEGVLTHGSGTITPLLSTFSPRRQPIGKILCDFIPNLQQTIQPLYPKLRLPSRLTKAEHEVRLASVLPTPAAELLSISIIPPTHSNDEAAARNIPSIVASASTSPASGNSSSKSISPTSGSHALPGALASPFPLVVVVNPTPNPTPHPTPPATPVLPVVLASDAVRHTHVPLPPRMSPDSPTLSRDRRQLNLTLATTLDLMPAFQTRSSAQPSIFGSCSPVSNNLLPPSPSANTSSSITSTSSANSNSSHLTASSSTSIHSNDTRSPNATLKPHDARKFFLKLDEHSSGSSDEPSPIRPDIATFTTSKVDAASSRAHGSPVAAFALGSYSTGMQNSNGDEGHSNQPPGLAFQSSVGQSSTSASGSWGESDVSGRRRRGPPLAKSSKGSSGRASGSSDGRSRSRSHGQAHDGLMMRKKAQASVATGRRGPRSGANVVPPQTHGHTRGQGPVASGDSLQLGTTFSSAHEHNRTEEKPTQVQRTHLVTPSPGHPVQVPPPMHSTTPARRTTFNIGSQSPSGSPSNTDLSTSSQAHTRSPPPSNAGPSIGCPPLVSPDRMRLQGHLPVTEARAGPLLRSPPPNVPFVVSSRQPRGLPHAASNLSAAEAVIQAPRTKRVVLADDDDDDWDETETDLDSDFEDDRKSDIDAEKGGTLVEPGIIGGGDHNDDGDWVSEEDEPESSQANLPAKQNPHPAPPQAPTQNNIKRPTGVSRHQSQPDIPNTAMVSRQKDLEQGQRLDQPRLHQRSQHPVVQSRTSHRSERDQAHALNDAKLRDAALEAQRQREMFAKVPKRSYSNLSTRSQSGLLSQLMNPDPNIFPGDHPYRRGYSDVAVGGRTGNGLARLGMQPMTNLTANAGVRNHKSNLTTGAPGPSATQRGSTSAAESSTSVAASSVFKVAPLGPTKSAVALPIANSVTASSYKGDLQTIAGFPKGKQRQIEPDSNAGAYRPKGRPQDEEMEMEEESEDDRDQAYHISKSVAEQKLAAIADRRTAKKGSSSAQAGPPAALPLHPHPYPAPQPHRSKSQYIANTHERISTPPVQVPLPLGFPYNLPPAAPPSSPHTTRQLMLRKEMPESLRQNLLWSRKISNQELNGPRRNSSSALSPTLQPLTAIPTVVHVTKKRRPEPGESIPQEVEDARSDEDIMEPIRPVVMQRNRSWAGGGR